MLRDTVKNSKHQIATPKKIQNFKSQMCKMVWPFAGTPVSRLPRLPVRPFVLRFYFVDLRVLRGLIFFTVDHGLRPVDYRL